MTELTPMQAELCESNTTDYWDLKAFFINCTLKRSPAVSNTQGLMDISMEIMRRNGVEVEGIRAIDHEIATGVWPDLYSLQHLGYTIPPQADSGWIGEAGPGPSYLDEGSGGPENDFTNRNTTFAAWNMLHLARILKDAGGIPAHGNQRTAWDAGCHFDFPNPEYR